MLLNIYIAVVALLISGVIVFYWMSSVKNYYKEYDSFLKSKHSSEPLKYEDPTDLFFLFVSAIVISALWPILFVGLIILGTSIIIKKNIRSILIKRNKAMILLSPNSEVRNLIQKK